MAISSEKPMPTKPPVAAHQPNRLGGGDDLALFRRAEKRQSRMFGAAGHVGLNRGR